MYDDDLGCNTIWMHFNIAVRHNKYAKKEDLKIVYSCIRVFPPAEQARLIGVSQATPQGLQAVGLASISKVKTVSRAIETEQD